MLDPTHAILVVDDDLYWRELIVFRLMQNGYHHIVSAAGGEAALALLATHLQFGLIITDLNMPKMNGRELISSIKADDLRKQIPVLMVCEPELDQETELVKFLAPYGIPLLKKGTLTGDTLRHAIEKLTPK
jgi:CheY-like chemotaxis protein